VAAFFLLDYSQHGSYTLESSLLMVVQLGFLLAILKDRARLANVLGGLACLVRPDSVLLILPGLFMNREARRLRNLIWFAAIGLLWEGFALTYYGELVPNSYHAKAGLTGFLPFFKNAAGLVTDIGSAKALGLSPASSVLRTLVALASLAPLLHPGVRRRPVLLYSLVIYPWLLIVAYSIIGSPEGHSWEFHSARFLLRVSAVLGLLCLGTIGAAKLNLPGWVRMAGIGLALAYVLVNGAARTTEQVRAYRTRDTSYWGGARYDTYREIAEWARQAIPRDATVALNDVGTFAYFTDLKVIDLSGIVTRGYSRDERMNLERFLHRFKPAFVVISGEHPGGALSPALNYTRVAYFPTQGFRDFSVLRLDPTPN
jgi:hypothetical protein